MARISLIMYKVNLQNCAKGKICEHHIFCTVVQTGSGENVRSAISTQMGPTFSLSFACPYALRKILGKVRGNEVKYGTLLQTQGLFEGEV